MIIGCLFIYASYQIENMIITKIKTMKRASIDINYELINIHQLDQISQINFTKNEVLIINGLLENKT